MPYIVTECYLVTSIRLTTVTAPRTAVKTRPGHFLSDRSTCAYISPLTSVQYLAIYTERRFSTHALSRAPHRQ